MKTLRTFLLTALIAATAMSNADTNPFFRYQQWKTPHHTYPFGEIKTEHYMPAFEEGIRQGMAEIDQIANNPAEPTFANTIEAYERAGELLSVVEHCFFNISNTDSDDEIQAIEMQIVPKLSEYSSSILLNEKLFERVKTVYDRRENLKLTPEQLKLLEDIYEGFANNGANLSPEDKEQYRELTTRLSQLTTRFGQNVLNATNAWTMHVTREEDLNGLSEDTKTMLHTNAVKKGLEGWLLDLKPTTTLPVLQDCHNRDLRRELYMASNGRCIGGEFDNTQVIIDIVNTRLALARLLGNRNFAQKALRKTCAETQENVFQLLDQLRDAYMPAAQQEVREMQEFARSKGFYATLQPWDWSYYSKQLKDEKYSLSDDVLRPYFELESVKQGVFGLAKRLYGLTFRENKDIQVYHSEVSAYEVFDDKGKFLAVYYADFHPRDGKRGGAWMNDFAPQYKLKGRDHRPHIVNVMNFTKPVIDSVGNVLKPALLTYDEVETFLHEFGHGLHGMLTRCTYAAQSGTAVPRDFVELPSQFNENFLAEKEFLDTFAKHYKEGNTIPQDLIERIRTAANYHAAYGCVRQLSFGYLDMAWHTLEQPFTVPATLTAEQAVIRFGNEAMQSVAVMPVVPQTQMETAFTHIFSGGYAAGYYSYKWSELLDADAFAAFQEAQQKPGGTIFDKTTADRFRQNILERGGTEKPMTLYLRFRGKQPTIDALLRRDGITR